MLNIRDIAANCSSVYTIGPLPLSSVRPLVNTSFTESIRVLVKVMVMVINTERLSMINMLRIKVRSICPWDWRIFSSRSKPFLITAMIVKINTMTMPIAAIPQ